jgi:hypothetical protein
MVYIWKVGCSTKIARLQPLKQLPGTPLELLPEHVSRYDDAGPIRNSMDRPEQQSHPITRTSPSFVRPYSTVRPPPYVSDSITISSKPDATRGEEQLQLNRVPSPGEGPATKSTSHEIIRSLGQRQYKRVELSLGCSRTWERL